MAEIRSKIIGMVIVKENFWERESIFEAITPYPLNSWMLPGPEGIPPAVFDWESVLWAASARGPGCRSCSSRRVRPSSSRSKKRSEFGQKSGRRSLAEWRHAENNIYNPDCYLGSFSLYFSYFVWTHNAPRIKNLKIWKLPWVHFQWITTRNTL